MRGYRTIAFSISVLTASSQADVLLATLHLPGTGFPDYIGGWSQNPSPDPDALYRLYLGFAPTYNSHGPQGWFDVGNVIAHAGSPPAIYDILPATQSNWNAMVILLTNGVENGAGPGFEFASGGPNPNPWMYGESYLGLTQSTLLGAQITFLRLRFESITLEPRGPGSRITAHGYWEVWGVPSPASFVALLPLAAIAGKRKRNTSPSQ
jgi:hypothetical protein